MGVGAIGGALQLLADETPPRKAVLVVYATRREGVAPAISDPIFRRVIGDGLPGPLDYYPESLDLARYPDPSYREAVCQFLQAKYRGQTFDLFLAVGEAARDFLTRYRDDAEMQETPLVFAAAQRTKRAPNSTGIIVPLNLRATLEGALTLQPDIKRVAVVGGASPFDRSFETDARQEFKALESRVTFTYLTGLPSAEIYRQVGQLPPHSIVFLTSFAEDAEGQRFTPLESAQRLSLAANAPLYSWVNVSMGHGVVGGRMASHELQSTRLAELALRVLNGENAATIPVADVDWSVTQFDWAQLRRWGIAETSLPPGSQVLFRPRGAWEQYGGYIATGVALFLLQTALIVTLLVQQRARFRAEVALREREALFHLMADTAPVLMWRAGTDKKCDFFNRGWLEFTGRSLEQEIGDGWTEGVHPDDLVGCLATYSLSFDVRKAFRMEYRLRRADGEYRWVMDNGVPRFEDNGRFAGYIGTCIDITDYREAMDRLSESHRHQERLAGRLINAQEYERSRIARELHDDIGQQLAGLSIVMSRLQRRATSATPDPEFDEHLVSIRERTSKILESIRSTSYTLHPGALQHAGLVSALAAHCRELQSHHSLDLTFASEEVFDDLDDAVGLCLYRIAQEALRNVVTHAEARHVRVELCRTNGGVQISISDDGKGFDVQGARDQTEGLGLVSIQERTRLAGGTMSVLTEIGRGTHLRVTIPIREGTPSPTEPSSESSR